ncbi:nodulin homeobox isoform X1 [Sesamum indicum]|uniref:Nodulin homeobox isoform X1 n=2 Tax=Sesamum indicum TaxID=4182 RepID=A0A6I9TGH4_SESIN|nr:nodulin homeobox isoform X1 [Sesamum indicum]
MRALNEASTSTELINTLFRSRSEVALDLIAAVKGLHELSPQQLSKLIRDSGNNVVRHIAEDGSHIQVDLEKFARYLPLHLIAVIMSWERDKSTFKYLLCGILLLHSMCDLASRVPKFEQILLDDVKVSEQLIDLVFYILVLLGAYRQEHNNIPNDMVLLHSALVACSLKLLTVIVSPQFQEVAQVLIAYHKVDIFMDATFSAVCIDVQFLQTKLSEEHADSSANISPTAEETLNHLCQQCDSSLQFLQSLCQQKMFRECIVKNKELCGNGGVLILVQSVMSLKISPLYSTSLYMASVSRLKSKALSILLYLCEAESVSYLDEVASNPGSQNLAKSTALQVLELLKKMFGIDSRPLIASPEIIYPKGQLELNAMRLADVFSDDSNFRSFIMINFTEALAAIFLLPHGEFLSGWCSSDLPVCEDDAALEHPDSSTFPCSVPRSSYAHQRTSLLIKVIANLHCFVPDVCQDEKDHFLNKFVRFLQKGSQKLSNGFSSILDPEKTTTVSKNLGSLLSHAESLVPRFLNEDDVQLLRLFVSQFESLIVPAASEDHLVEDAHNTGVRSSSLPREIAANHDNNDINMEECMRENVTLQEVDQLDQSVDGQRKTGTMELGKSNGVLTNLADIERDARTVETSGSDSSPTRGKNTITRVDVDHIKGSVLEETLEDEKVDAIHSDEKQQRKRKRTIMNDKQIALIESALVDEPDMHRNSTSLRMWADKLSLHGAEVTTSRLKNWLNNRKARLARAAKDVRVSYEGDNLDRQGSGLDSPHSPMDDARVASAVRGSVRNDVIDTAVPASVDENLGTSVAAPRGSGLYFEPGQYVMLVGEKAEEVGKGKVFQVRGKWCGRSLEQSGTCVVDIVELSIDRFAKLLHPVEATGNSFYQAEKRLGLMRVLWDLNKLFQLPSR